MALGDLIHQHVRAAVEQAVDEEVAAVLGVGLYERSEARRGHRNGTKTRTLTGPTGPLELTLPRAALFTPSGPREWAWRLVPGYQGRSAEVNEAVASGYLAGANTRRIQGALRPLLKAAPLSKSAVSRVVGTLRSAWEAWTKRSLAELDLAYLYLDGIALRVRSAGKVTSVPVLAAVAGLAGGQKQPVGLGRCCVHKLRNLVRKAPEHAREEITDDFHRIVYAASEVAARAAYVAFTSRWKSRCPGVVRGLEEAGDELLTMYRFPKQQWKTIRTTNVIERLNGECRRRVKTH